jgi:flagellar hook assembly protein FlgD
MTENKKAGYYSVQWNGTNEYGNQVASGTYFYHIKAGKHNSVKKMLLIK